jgi:hypothetical protein
MKKLENLFRPDGYPWCADTAEVINALAEVVEASFWWLTEPEGDGGVFLFGYATLSAPKYAVWVNRTKTSQQVLRLFTDIPASLTNPDYPTMASMIANPGKFTITPQTEHISINGQSAVYPDCIAYQKGEIVLAAPAGAGQTFMSLRDAMYLYDRWKYVPLNTLAFNLSGPHTPPVLDLTASWIRHNVAKRAVEMDLKINHFPDSQPFLSIRIPEASLLGVNLPVGRWFPINTIAGEANWRVPVPSYIVRQTNGEVLLVVDYAAVDFPPPSYIPTETRINGIVKYR